MITKLFGKWAGVASASIALAIAVAKIARPELLATDLAVTIITLLTGHAAASDSPFESVKK